MYICFVKRMLNRESKQWRIKWTAGEEKYREWTEREPTAGASGTRLRESRIPRDQREPCDICIYEKACRDPSFPRRRDVSRAVNPLGVSSLQTPSPDPSPHRAPIPTNTESYSRIYPPKPNFPLARKRARASCLKHPRNHFLQNVTRKPRQARYTWRDCYVLKISRV